MKRKLMPYAATLALLVSSSAFAWDDPGSIGSETASAPRPTTFEEEMRDLRQLHKSELALRAEQQRGDTLTFEQEMRDLRTEYRASQQRALRAHPGVTPSASTPPD